MNKQRVKNLWLYGAGIAAARSGAQFKFLAVTSVTYALTGSPLLTALQMAVNSIPFILLARVVGPIIDRHDPKKISAVAYMAQAGLSLLFLLTRDVYHIILLNLLVASIGVFHVVARSKLLPQIVGKENIFQANARLATINGAALLLAPAAAGSLLTFIGVFWSLAIYSLSLLVAGLAVCFVTRMEEMTVSQDTKVSPSLSPVWDFLRAKPERLVLIGLFVSYTVGMWAVSGTFYPYCSDVLAAGPEVMGWSISTYFGAYLITGVALERWGKPLSNVLLLPFGYILGALTWGAYTLTKSIPLVLVLSALDGVFYTFTLTRMDIWVQEEAPAEVRGRVTAVVRAWEESAIVSGQLGGGAIASMIGVLGGMRVAAFGTAVLVGCGVLLGGMLIPERGPDGAQVVAD